MAASTAPEAKRRILTLLQARAGLSGVDVDWGGPVSVEKITADMVYFDGPVTRDPSWDVVGGLRLDERYTLTLQGWTIRKGGTEQAAEERGWVLVDEIEQGVRADLRLAGLLYEQINFGEQTVDAAPIPDGWRVSARVALELHARI